jgi:phospholipid-binding lipoprotein MlaA
MLRTSDARHGKVFSAAAPAMLCACMCIAPAFAQSASADSNAAPASGQNAPAASQATSPPQTATPASGQTGEDAQLPPYLQDNPDAETENAVPDPWERYNRHIYRFNKGVDKAIIKPLALTYKKVVPKPMRTGVSHFFDNLHQPLNTVHLLLQGHPRSSVQSLGRFLVNTTIGIGGLFDPATALHIPQFEEDAGQTLGHWGWRHSRYFLLPFFGPGTVRDRIGTLIDSEIGPYHYIERDRTRIGLRGLSLVDSRVQILPLDELSQGIDDDYVLVREAWGQRRNHQIDDQTVHFTDDASNPGKQ